MKLTTKSICLCALFSIVIAIGAFIKIPISIVPITLQTLFVLLAGLILGKYLATVSVAVYIIMGLIGLPVFANGGGFGYILQPSFGYLLGFLLAAYVVGYCASRWNTRIQIFLICILGMLIIYMVGMFYFLCIQKFYFHETISFSWMFQYLFLVYLPGDILSCIFATILKQRLPYQG